MTTGTDLVSVPWRTGRKLGRTLYARTGGGDWEADAVIGMMDTPELAEEACAAHNAALLRREDPESGTASAPGSEWFVLQERKPGADWENVMSLGGWHDPAVRREALAVFRGSGERQPGGEYRMVRHVESALAE